MLFVLTYVQEYVTRINRIHIEKEHDNLQTFRLSVILPLLWGSVL